MTLRCLLLTMVTLAGAASLLGTQQKPPKQFENTERDLVSLSRTIDAEVDSILSQFQIASKNIRKRTFTIPTTNLNRVERRVTIPSDVDPLHINQAMNIMAKQYDGRAIGSENMKDNTVTIHIKLDGYILETIILKSLISKKPIKRKK